MHLSGMLFKLKTTDSDKIVGADC